jgi:hypothetical protein
LASSRSSFSAASVFPVAESVATFPTSSAIATIGRATISRK